MRDGAGSGFYDVHGYMKAFGVFVEDREVYCICCRIWRGHERIHMGGRMFRYVDSLGWHIRHGMETWQISLSSCGRYEKTGGIRAHWQPFVMGFLSSAS